MRNPTQAVAGGVLTVIGSVFFLQGIDVLKGSGMSNTVTWSVLGPIIAISGLTLVVRGARSQRP